MFLLNGENYVREKEAAFLVKMTKVRKPNGEEKTRSVILYDAKAYIPKSEIINEILPTVDKEYLELLEKSHKEGLGKLKDNLDIFMRNISNHVIIGGIKETLSHDLQISMDTIEEVLLSTKMIQELIDYVRKEFRKVNKEDFVTYAESTRQLVELFGSKKTLSLLHKRGINMKKRTLDALCKVACETPKIKRMIRDKSIVPTLVFELPRINEDEREKVAERLASKTYAEAKEYLKKVKQVNR